MKLQVLADGRKLEHLTDSDENAEAAVGSGGLAFLRRGMLV